LGYRQSDSNNQLTTISFNVWKSNLRLVSQDKFDPINVMIMINHQLITLSVISLSSAHCTRSRLVKLCRPKKVLVGRASLRLRLLTSNHYCGCTLASSIQLKWKNEWKYLLTYMLASPDKTIIRSTHNYYRLNSAKITNKRSFNFCNYELKIFFRLLSNNSWN
jgi:hypothetical protein